MYRKLFKGLNLKLLNFLTIHLNCIEKLVYNILSTILLSVYGYLLVLIQLLVCKLKVKDYSNCADIIWDYFLQERARENNV